MDITQIEKIPPQNLEAEMSLLGSILIDKEAMMKIADIIDSEDFYKNIHGNIYEVMVELYGRNEPLDVLMLGNRLEEKGVLENHLSVGDARYYCGMFSGVHSGGG